MSVLRRRNPRRSRQMQTLRQRFGQAGKECAASGPIDFQSQEREKQDGRRLRFDHPRLHYCFLKRCFRRSRRFRLVGGAGRHGHFGRIDNSFARQIRKLVSLEITR